MSRALIFDPSARDGGGVSYLLNLAEALRDCERSSEFVFVCNPALRGRLRALERYSAVDYLPRLAARGGPTLAAMRRSALKRAVRRFRPDAVLSMNQLEWQPPCRSALFLRNALYFWDPDARTSGRLRLIDRVRLRLLRAQAMRSIAKADCVLTPTRAFADMVTEATDGRVWPTVVPFGLNVTALSSGSRDYGRADRLLCLHYNRYKDHETVVDAFVALAGDYPRLALSITDDLAGSSNGSARDLYQRIEASGFQQRIECLGKLPHHALAEIYAASDLYIHSSVVESFGHGLLEAMGNGMACLATDIAVNREIGGAAVAYYRAGSSQDLARQISTLLRDRTRRELLGHAAAARASTFSWASHAGRLEAVLFC